MSTLDRIAGVSGDTAFKEACRVATTANITLSGLQTLDGVTLVDGDRVVVAFQTDTVENGVYNASAGVWTRSKDFNGSRDVTRGTRVSVVDGTLYANNIFVLTSANTVVIGTSAITFVLDATISAASAAAAAASATDSDNSATASAASAVTAGTISASAREAIGFSWEFDDTITMADPTSTKFRMNNADPTAVTAIAIADNTADTGTPDVSTFVLAWDDSASTLKGHLILREIDNPEKFAIFNITGSSTDNSGWTQLAVTYVTGSSTFTDTGDIMITFSRTGDVGDASAVLPSIVATDTGKLMVVNTAGDSFELLSSGTAGQKLTSAGSDAIPTWESAGTWADYDGTADGTIDLSLFTTTNQHYAKRVAKLSSTEAVLIWLDSVGEDILGRILTYNPSTKVITAGAEQVIRAGGVNAFGNDASYMSQKVEVIDSTNFVFGYREYNGSINEGKVALCSVSGDTITVDSTATYAINLHRIDVSLIDSTKIAVGITNNTTVKANIASITVGSSITFNSWVDVDATTSSSDSAFSIKVDSGGECGIIICRDTTTSTSTNTFGFGISGTTVTAGTNSPIQSHQGYQDNYGQVLIRNVDNRAFAFLTNSMYEAADTIYRSTFAYIASSTTGSTSSPTTTGVFAEQPTGSDTVVQSIEMSDHDLVFNRTQTGVHMTVTSKGIRPTPLHSKEVLSFDDTTGNPNVDFSGYQSCCFVAFDDDSVACVFGDSTTAFGYKIIKKQ